MDRVAILLVNAAMMSTAFRNVPPEISTTGDCIDRVEAASERVIASNLPDDMREDLSVLLRIAKNLCEARNFALASSILAFVSALSAK